MEYFIESIAEDRKFPAFQCDKYDNYENGMCLRSAGQLQNMGHDWQEQNSVEGRKHFTITREEFPFSGEFCREAKVVKSQILFNILIANYLQRENKLL